MGNRCRCRALVLALTFAAACAPALERTPGELAPPVLAGEDGLGVPAEAQSARVEKIVDGDTIRVVVDQDGSLARGREHKIRILEIDAPEVGTPERPEECGASEATRFAQEQLRLGSTVYLLADREDVDGFGRFLRYVWNSTGEFYNEKAVAHGHARAVLFRPNDLYIDRMRAAEKQAKSARVGIWSAACW